MDFPSLKRQNASSFLRSETGIKLCEAWDYSWGAFLLKEKAAYIFEQPFHTGTVVASFVGVPGDFTVTTFQESLNLGGVGLGASCQLGANRTLSIDLEYEGEFGSAYLSNEFMLAIRKSF